MKSLGIIVDELGNYKSFGKWKNRMERDINCKDDWHDDSFMKDIYPTDWFNSLKVPYNTKIRFDSQLDIFARCGKLVIANGMNDIDEKNVIRLVIVAPSDMSLEQINFLLDMKIKFKRFDKNNILLVDLFERSEDYKIVKQFYDIKKFYKYLKQLLKQKKKEEKYKIKVNLFN